MNYHFLDSNIFLSIATKDSAKDICEKYFKSNSIKVTSENVKKESNNVLSKLEKISFEVIGCIRKFILVNKIPDEKIASSLYIVKRKFLNKYSFEDYPFGFNRKKFLKIVNRLFSYYNDILKYSISSSFEIWINEEFLTLKSDYKNYYSALNFLFKKVDLYHYSINLGDAQIIGFLNDIGIHSPDAEILLDAFKTSDKLDNVIYFITRDNGIINNSTGIFSIFNGEVIPKKPEEFLNN
ncbi:MAG: hypothetical protein IJ258_06945 [Methanobrevibacter sp.]|uniref:hypothetical protein n=1 Tax=Methanobrevibacter sp. TaxID=66852 RepID=UPI0025FBC3E2|nr:hypothetical protein [Methanobrevibacter sp.]MBQ8017828.1 hypothetical protein [Methanobrevibacter sp.]